MLFAGRGYSIKVLKVGNVVRLIAKAMELTRIVKTCSTTHHILVAYCVLYIVILLHGCKVMYNFHSDLLKCLYTRFLKLYRLLQNNYTGLIGVFIG